LKIIIINIDLNLHCNYNSYYKPFEKKDMYLYQPSRTVEVCWGNFHTDYQAIIPPPPKIIIDPAKPGLRQRGRFDLRVSFLSKYYSNGGCCRARHRATRIARGLRRVLFAGPGRAGYHGNGVVLV